MSIASALVDVSPALYDVLLLQQLYPAPEGDGPRRCILISTEDLLLNIWLPTTQIHLDFSDSEGPLVISILDLL